MVEVGGGKEANPKPLLLELVGVVLKALKGSKEELVEVPLEVEKAFPPGIIVEKIYMYMYI